MSYSWNMVSLFAPKPVKISANLVAWRAEDIRALLEKTTAKEEA